MKKLAILLSLLWMIALPLAAADPSSRLAELEDKISKSTLPDSSYSYVQQLIDLAKKEGNNESLCSGYLWMVILSYNDFNMKETRKWVDLLVPLAEKEKFYDMLFRGKQCLVDLTLLNEEFEKGENEAKKMLEQATEMKHEFGIVLAHLCLSHAYSMSYQPELAAEELEKAYPIASKTTGLVLNTEITFALSETYQTLKDFEKQLKYLLIQEAFLKEYLMKNPSEKNLLQREFMLTYSLLSSCYAERNDSKSAYKYLELAQKYYASDIPGFFQVFYYKAKTHTSVLAADFETAITAIDTLLELHADVFTPDHNEFLFTKAQIYNKMGRLSDAVDLYRQVVQIDDSIHVVILNKQIRELEQINETERLLLEQKQIQSREQRSLLVAIVVVLGMVIGYAFYSWTVKRDLSKAEQQMRRMSKQMEAANVAKDCFMSNITQTIKDPLDVIVGSVERLVDNKTISDAQNKELSDRIKTTSEELMVLINNILDLSRLEAGMMKFQKEKIPLGAYLTDLYGSNPSVVFVNNINASSKYSIEVDKKRIKEVLDSLLVPEKSPVGVAVAIQENCFEMTVRGAKLSLENAPQDDIIRNEINKMLLHCFNGDYQILREKVIVVTLPVSVVG